jgi:hypothetical protein
VKHTQQFLLSTNFWCLSLVILTSGVIFSAQLPTHAEKNSISSSQKRKPSEPQKREPSKPSEPQKREPSKPSEPQKREPSKPSEPQRMEPDEPNEPQRCEPGEHCQKNVPVPALALGLAGVGMGLFRKHRRLNAQKDQT